MKPTPVLAKGYENVYDPVEDSFFLLDCLEKDQTFLESIPGVPLIAEIGTGTGIVSAFIPQIRSESYIAVAGDVNPAACACAKETWQRNWHNNRLQVVRGDLLTWTREGSVDVLIFNPPYVPSEVVPKQPVGVPDYDDKWVDLALDGGCDGMEITNRVLENLKHWLSPRGVAYILFCASNHPDKVCEEMKTRGWSSVHIDTRCAGCEILSVYRFARLT